MTFPAIKLALVIGLAGIGVISWSLFAARHGAALAGYAL
jgi:hypothetical protein